MQAGAVETQHSELSPLGTTGRENKRVELYPWWVSPAFSPLPTHSPLQSSSIPIFPYKLAPNIHSSPILLPKFSLIFSIATSISMFNWYLKLNQIWPLRMKQCTGEQGNTVKTRNRRKTALCSILHFLPIYHFVLCMQWVQNDCHLSEWMDLKNTTIYSTGSHSITKTGVHHPCSFSAAFNFSPSLNYTIQ